MSCKRFEQEWEGWLRGQASRAFLEHLGECRACADQAAELGRTREWLAPLRQEPPLPGAAFWARLAGGPGAEDRAGGPRAAAAGAQPPPPRPSWGKNGGGFLPRGQPTRAGVFVPRAPYQEPQR